MREREREEEEKEEKTAPKTEWRRRDAVDSCLRAASCVSFSARL